MANELVSIPSRAVETHVHVDLTAYRPVEEFLSVWGERRAVLSEHLASADSEYIVRLVRDAPERFRGLLLLERDLPDSTRVDVILREPHLFGARIPVHSMSDVAALDALLSGLDRRMGFASLHCTWSVASSASLLEVVHKHSGVDIRIEHFGSWAYDKSPRFAGPARNLLSAPNVYTMVSGQYAFTSEKFPYPRASAVMRQYVHEVGASRLMWSTDWNRNDLDSGRSENYVEESFDLLGDLFSESETRDVLWRTAERFFRFVPAKGES